MKAVVFPGDRTVEVREFPDPTPGPRDVIIEIRSSGLCGSDLHAYRAPAATRTNPRVAGHEPCGVVVEVGSAVTEAKVGDRVMQHHYDGCGTCRHCTSGWTQLCEIDPLWFGSINGDGGHAQFMRAPAHTLVPLPEELTFAAGSAVACGTGTAYGAIKRIGLQGDEIVSVFGQGPVGLSATMLATEMGSRVIAIDLSPERRQAALERGAIAALDPATDDVPAAIKDLSHGEGAHKSIETSGAEPARADAARSTRSWGTVAMVGIGGNLVLESFMELIRKQLTIVGHLTFSKAGQADCAQYVVDRGIDVDSLFTHNWSLDEADEAYRLFDAQSTGKAYIDPSR